MEARLYRALLSKGYILMNKYQDYFRSLQKSSSGYKYEHPKTGEVFTYRRKGIYKKGGVTLIKKGRENEV